MKVLVVSGSSTTRALLGSLLPSSRYQVASVDSLTTAEQRVRQEPPQVVLLQAEIARASPDAITRLQQAAGSEIGVVLADRAYLDDRRGSGDVQALGAQVYVPLPPEAAALEEAVQAAARTSNVGQGAPLVSNEPEPDDEPDEVEDDGQFARLAERLWSMLDQLDAYQLLRVARSADQETIHAAFRQRAMEYHPDRARDVDEQVREHIYQIFKRVSWAFRQLGDPDSRRAYDAKNPPKA